MAARLLRRRRATTACRRCRAAAAAGAGPRSVVVVGADGAAGRAVAEAVAAAGLLAAATCGSGAGVKALQAAGAAEVLVGDPTEAAFVAGALGAVAPAAVVSCVGGDAGAVGAAGRTPDADFAGNKAVIAAAKARGVGHFVLVSAIGAGPSLCALPGPAKDVMKPLMDEKHKAELVLMDSGLPYTILRSGPVNAGFAGVGDPLVTEDRQAYGEISGAGLGALVVRCLQSEAAKGRVLSALDGNHVYQTNPFLRPLESFEPKPFEVVTLP